MPTISTPVFAFALAVMFTLTAGQNDDFRANGLANGIYLCFTHSGLEKLNVAALNTDHGKTGVTVSLIHPTTLTNKYFSHFVCSFHQ
jgi:hypothetical protein